MRNTERTHKFGNNKKVVQRKKPRKNAANSSFCVQKSFTVLLNAGVEPATGGRYVFKGFFKFEIGLNIFSATDERSKVSGVWLRKPVVFY